MRTRLRACICPELRKRVDFHLTNYREYGSRAHEIWITVDGEKVFSASYYGLHDFRERPATRKGTANYVEGKEGKVAHEALTRAEIHDASITIYTFRKYLDSNRPDFNVQYTYEHTGSQVRDCYMATFGIRLPNRGRQKAELAEVASPGK